MKPGSKNTFNSLKKIKINGAEYNYYSLKEAEKNGLEDISRLPKSIKVLLENLLRYEDDLSVNKCCWVFGIFIISIFRCCNFISHINKKNSSSYCNNILKIWVLFKNN